jgi:predicted nucleotide-binding protein (sugar kinase/HSP70/actin superfamily)
MFKITNDFEKLLNLLKYNKINNILEDFFNSKVYNDLCDFIVYDIFNKLISNKKIDMFLNRYFNIVGIKIINSIINKLLKIIFLTFVDMSYF